VARLITAAENAKIKEDGYLADMRTALQNRLSRTVPVLGITGTGGAGKSSLVDELVTRFLNDQPDKSVAILSVDPSRRKTGGALLGDRIRLNSLGQQRVYMRSLATRKSLLEISDALEEAILIVKAAGFDLVIVETAGIGQGDAAVVTAGGCVFVCHDRGIRRGQPVGKNRHARFRRLVAINKFDRQGAEDALRDVRKQYQRNRKLFDRDTADMPVYGTIASKFNDDGVTSLYLGVLDVPGRTNRHRLDH
jgi:methylmalonyl-CoA mutase